MQMRSYEAARKLFGILGFLSWCVIIVGALIAIITVVLAGEMSRGFGGPPMAGLAGLIPGFAIMFLGFLGLVFVQMGRAGVDSAEYAQQNLKIAREQLEVSKQALKQGVALEQGYAALQAAKADVASDKTAPVASFADVKSDLELKPNQNSTARSTIDHKGKIIRQIEGGYEVGDTVFETLDKAKRHIDDQSEAALPHPEQPQPYADQLGVNTASKADGPKPS